MTFNPKIWAMLRFAYSDYQGTGMEREAVEALEEYAAACDGKIQWQDANTFEFVPNPIPKY